MAKQNYLPIHSQLMGISKSKRLRKSQSTGSTIVFSVVERAEAYIRRLQDLEEKLQFRVMTFET